MLQKFTSRKFLIALAGLAVGAATLLGADGETIVTVAGSLAAIASAISYIVTEGKVDAANAAGATETTVEIEADEQEGE